jgi:hypothetical protein
MVVSVTYSSVLHGAISKNVSLYQVISLLLYNVYTSNLVDINLKSTIRGYRIA